VDFYCNYFQFRGSVFVKNQSGVKPLDADHEGRWPKYGVFLAVTAGHLGLIAWLLAMPPATAGGDAGLHPVEIAFLPPASPPKVKSPHPPPTQVSWGETLHLSLPVLTSPDRAEAPGSRAVGDGTGTGVDWAAEARRALHAFEIRSHLPPSNNSVSGDQADMWLRQAHHAGDRMKIANGDWIVWLDEKCYQVATAAQTGSLSGMGTPAVICPRPSP
jgi:hypothetical protein